MEAMLTVRISKDVKDRVTSILREKDLTVSSVVQQLFDDIIRTGDVPVAQLVNSRPSKEEIARRVELFRRFRLDEPLQMTDDEIRAARLGETYGFVA
jgi:antitoxin component of RelBE/YafQ-DinJ toxin-antitoxin module